MSRRKPELTRTEKEARRREYDRGVGALGYEDRREVLLIQVRAFVKTPKYRALAERYLRSGDHWQAWLLVRRARESA